MSLLYYPLPKEKNHKITSTRKKILISSFAFFNFFKKTLSLRFPKCECMKKILHKFGEVELESITSKKGVSRKTLLKFKKQLRHIARSAVTLEMIRILEHPCKGIFSKV